MDKASNPCIKKVEPTFVSRKDRQVKFNGYRVELDGIEKKLNQYSGVALSAVELVQIGDVDSLVAFIEPRQRSIKKEIDFSLFFFAQNSGSTEVLYDLYLESAKYADANGFSAIWTPERHFSIVTGKQIGRAHV